MMTGDVAGAFRHVPFNCWFCGYFSGYIPELDLIVVNLCLPFGWTGSPVHSSIAGQAIKVIHNSRPGFQNLVYSDDHILIGDSHRFETQVSGIALRRAMVTVLGTTACNEKKFTTWQRQCRALGLIFDFDSQTVSIQDCQDCGAFVGPLRHHQGHLKTATRDNGFTALPGDVYPGSETVL